MRRHLTSTPCNQGVPGKQHSRSNGLANTIQATSVDYESEGEIATDSEMEDSDGEEPVDVIFWPQTLRDLTMNDSKRTKKRS